MTTPIAHGYSDWGRYSAQSDVILIDVQAESVNPSVDHGPFFCGGFEYICMRMCPDTKSFQYQLIWQNDSAGTVTLVTDGAVMPIASCNQIIFPVLGPWLTIRATPRTAPGSHGFSAYIVPTGAAIVGANADGAIFTSPGFFNIAALGTQVFDFTNVYAGELSVWTHTQSTSAIIEIAVLDLAGAATLLAAGSDTGAGMPKDTNFILHVPPRPIRVTCINFTAAIAEYAFSMSGRITHGGR